MQQASACGSFVQQQHLPQERIGEPGFLSPTRHSLQQLNAQGQGSPGNKTDSHSRSWTWAKVDEDDEEEEDPEPSRRSGEGRPRLVRKEAEKIMLPALPDMVSSGVGKRMLLRR